MPSPAFLQKKAEILKALAQSSETYTDKSPKGSVDAPIVDLINEINRIDGLVTTSSCSGRVAVFVEGSRSQLVSHDEDEKVPDDDEVDGDGGDLDDGDELNVEREDDSEKTKSKTSKKKKVKTGPGGKGGGQWLFVSHDPVPLPSPQLSTGKNDTATSDSTTSKNHFTKLCGLQESDDHDTTSGEPHDDSQTATERRLIRLSFSPLILHILTADLSLHARPLLSAAINAGFRESGVQSLAALDQSNSSTPSISSSTKSAIAGTMLAIRTAGLAFETIIGQAITTTTTTTSEKAKTKTIYKSLVSEEYLRLCFSVIYERFQWNERRKQRLREEIRKAFERVEGRIEIERKWEGKEERRRRLREEGLVRKTKIREERERSGFERSSGGSGGGGLDGQDVNRGDDIDDGIGDVGGLTFLDKRDDAG